MFGESSLRGGIVRRTFWVAGLGRAWSQKELDDVVERVGGEGGGTCKNQPVRGLVKDLSWFSGHG